MASLVGKTIGKYRLLELLGRGGMAEVYKSRHPTLGRDVTVKVLHRHLADGEGFLARFEREAKAVAGLRHPHIVQIFDYEATDEANYMVMEFVDAGTLQDRLVALAKEGKYLPVREALAILGQVAEALDYAHGRGILHRDVKPSNILLDSSGNAFLTDFGIARILGETKFTVTGVMIGTPAYMSPEQGSGEELTGASDIYSLGIIAYELLGGKVPFSSETTPLAIIHKHINEQPPNLRALRPDLPAAAEAAVMKALAKKPEDRYATAGGFILALRNALPDSAVANLDSAREKRTPLVSRQPTEVMEDLPAPGRAQMVTEVMEAQAEEPPPMPETAPAGSGAPQEKQAMAVQKAGKKPQPPAGPPLLKRIPRVIWIAGGLILVALLALVGWSLFNRSMPSACNSTDACITQAQDLRAHGDLAGFVDKMAAAIDHVAPDQHRPNAVLWCDKADGEKQLNRTADAQSSYNQCIAWTENDPALQFVRDRANQGLAGLR